MSKRYTSEEIRLSVIFYKMVNYVEEVMQILAKMYPELTNLSGFASFELKRCMMLSYINGVLESTETRDLENFLINYYQRIKEAANDEQLKQILL